jgi:hypothetical protein
MDSFFSNLWNKNRVLFFILIPLVILWVLKDILLKSIVFLGNREFKKAVEKDKEIKSEQDRLNNQANDHKANSDRLEKEIEKISEDEEWHKK